MIYYQYKNLSYSGFLSGAVYQFTHLRKSFRIFSFFFICFNHSVINGIDIVGCGLSQNIKKKLKEKEKEKINLVN